VFGRGIGGALAGVALIHPGDLDMVVGDSLYDAGEPFDLAAVRGAG